MISRAVTLVLGTGLVLVSGACGSSGGGAPTVTSSAASSAVATGEALPSTSPTPSTPGVRLITVTVDGEDVTGPSKVTVKAGEQVTLRVTADSANEVHVHGLDIEREIAAGVPMDIPLTFPDPGVYEIELHDPALHLLDVTVGSVGG